MCFEPVKFCFSNRTIVETDGALSLELTPVALPVKPDQARENADAPARRDSLGLPNLAENFESHERDDTSPEILTG